VVATTTSDPITINVGQKDDILGTWPSGVYYRDSETGSWVKMSSAAKLVATEDIDSDSTDDLIGVWNSGLYVKYSLSGGWFRFASSLPSDIDAGLLRGGAWYAEETDLAATARGYKEGPESITEDLSDEVPGGRYFLYQEE
jgi:hypothetical protein